MDIEFVDNLAKSIEKMVNDGHAINEAKSGIVCDYKRFSIICKIKNDIAGVLQAYTAYAEIHVEDIFVNSHFRRKGIGRKLMDKLEGHFFKIKDITI